MCTANEMVVEKEPNQRQQCSTERSARTSHVKQKSKLRCRCTDFSASLVLVPVGFMHSFILFTSFHVTDRHECTLHAPHPSYSYTKMKFEMLLKYASLLLFSLFHFN